MEGGGFLLYNIDNVESLVAFTTKRTVGRNRPEICSMLGIDDSRLIYPHQTHGTKLLQIGEDFLTLSPETKKMLLEGIDAVMTNVAGVCVAVSTADCIPVLLYDGEHHAVAAVHAGWRGTVGRIVRKALEQMNVAYGTKPASLQCVIGPGISQECFEVGDEVYEAFAVAGFDMEKIACRKEKWHIDLWRANSLELEDLGVNPANIHVEEVCTFSHSNEYFSARHDGAATGRMLNGIMLKQP